MPGIGILLALVLLVFSGATLAGLAVAAMTGDMHGMQAFAILSVVYGTISIFTYMVATTKRRPFKRAGVFIGAIAMWFTLVLAAMPPFLILENAHPVAAFFEASSAATTLGTSLVPVSEMSTAMIFYRSIVAWLGGLLTLMLAVYVLGRYAVGGTPNRDLRFILHGASRGTPRLSATFIEVVIPYITMTLLCIVILMLVRVNPVHAVLGGLNTLATNGFIGWQTRGSIFNNQVAELVLMVFMMVGASSIIWQRTFFSQKIRHTRQQGENLAFLVLGISAIVLGNSLVVFADSPAPRIWDQVLQTSFDIISTLTTTGMTHTSSVDTQISMIFLIGLALIGGTSYSTAGGLKIFRFSAMMRHSINEILRLIYPNQLLPGSVDTDINILSTTKATWSSFFSAMILIVVGMAIFASLGHQFVSALALSVGAFTSLGNMVEQNLFSVQGNGEPYLSLILVSLLGIAGRIELLVILAAFSKNRW